MLPICTYIHTLKYTAIHKDVTKKAIIYKYIYVLLGTKYITHLKIIFYRWCWERQEIVELIIRSFFFKLYLFNLNKYFCFNEINKCGIVQCTLYGTHYILLLFCRRDPREFFLLFILSRWKLHYMFCYEKRLHL